MMGGSGGQRIDRVKPVAERERSKQQEDQPSGVYQRDTNAAASWIRKGREKERGSVCVGKELEVVYQEEE